MRRNFRAEAVHSVEQWRTAKSRRCFTLGRLGLRSGFFRCASLATSSSLRGQSKQYGANARGREETQRKSAAGGTGWGRRAGAHCDGAIACCVIFSLS